MKEIFYTPPEAARIAGVTPATIRAKIAAGDLEAISLVGCSRIGRNRTVSLISASSLKKFILNNLTPEAKKIVRASE